jgi:hypothetical protein
MAWGWVFLFLIPMVNLGFWIVVCDQLALKFGKGIGHTLGLTWLGFIFCPLLGFGPAEYEGTEGKKDLRPGERLPRLKKRRDEGTEEEEAPLPRRRPRRDA